MLTSEDIAAVCHEANRAYCQRLGDSSQKPWVDAPEWQRRSAADGVQFRLENPEAPASAQHEQWMKAKLADGWKFGLVKDAEKKEHPDLIPYGDLPLATKRKDALFAAIVGALNS